MRVILRRMKSLSGLSVATDEVVDADRLTLGRGTDQNVQLPDVRVTLAHAALHQQPGGGWRLECSGDNRAWVNGSPQLKASLGVGDTIDLGRFRLTLAPPEGDAELVFLIEERTSSREEKGRRRGQFRMDLAAAGLSKRRAAWTLALVVLALVFVMPALLRYGSGGSAGKSLDALWQAGPPSAAHSAFVHDCDVCHQTPFAAVRNDACLACHERQAQHSGNAGIVAHEGLADAQCRACHLEHTGRDALIARQTNLCTDCHADPAGRFAQLRLAAVSRFDGDHPGFTLSLPAWKDGTRLTLEVPQDGGGALREDTHLRFPHDLHVVANGVSSPDGKRVLECAICHRPAGRSFAPIRMEEHCMNCHRLDFDPDHPERRLPHRMPEEVAAIIRDHFARDALAGGVREPDAPEIVRLVRRPGEPLAPEQSRIALAWADNRALLAMENVFERRLCSGCHEVARTDDPARPWSIAPVAVNGPFLEGARFDHAAHGTEDCARCHAAKSSKSSADVLVPPLATCRECHGDPGVSGRTPTACVDCHGFHRARTSAGAQPALPADEPRAARSRPAPEARRYASE